MSGNRIRHVLLLRDQPALGLCVTTIAGGPLNSLLSVHTRQQIRQFDSFTVATRVEPQFGQ